MWPALFRKGKAAHGLLAGKSLKLSMQTPNRMNTDMIKERIEKILDYIGASCDGIDVLRGDDGVTRFLIKTGEPMALIGQGGLTLLAINHIVRKMAEKDEPKSETEANFVVDVNDYQKNKMEELKQKAKMMAERARFFKSSVELEPMSSYERMIVHSFLTSFNDITTESVGLGQDRRVVIKYKEGGN